MDTKVEYHGTSFVTDPVQTLPKIRKAAEAAVARCKQDGREIVMIEVILRVKPR
ncbi:hypothetical protein V4D00_02390 [Ralstonia solanacearum]|uniref:hypothetical protein n=1 Tax=Ralstonia solanacearum TaxID=305 RepID=UPI000B0D8698|nr:hypothetical protein [Ralstonia solanacearum]